MGGPFDANAEGVQDPSMSSTNGNDTKEASKDKKPSTSNWQDLTKSKLLDLFKQFSKQTYSSDGDLQRIVGNAFETSFHHWAENSEELPIVGGLNFINSYTRNEYPDEYDDGCSEIPLHSSRTFTIIDAKATIIRTYNNKVIPYVNAAHFEIKAMDKVVTLSTNNYQIMAEIQSLPIAQPLACKAKVAQYHIVTTANGAIGNSVNEFAYIRGINVFNWRPQYKIENNEMFIRFGYESSKKDGKNRPILREVYTSYIYSGSVRFQF